MELRKAWCRETAHPSYQCKWSEDNPSVGQCLVTALVIQDEYGGDIYSCKVGNHRHFVNIIDERIVDQTAEQFGGVDRIQYINGSFRKREREELLKNQNIKYRYELLKSRIKGIE
jgi:hypothetical protein